jgi:hypothetical protein
MIIVANYAFESSFMTPHLEREEVFGSTKHNVDFSLRVDDKLHRPNCINFSCPRVAVFWLSTK